MRISKPVKFKVSQSIKILENSFSGAFAGMKTALPLHKKIKTGSYQIRVGNTYEVLGIAKCSREEIKRSEL